ncbi:MAG: hypothetical protein OXK82_08580 [Deltaproteobacteria bacterium]|nr:hypothetical protein [Deltaproteobacteria bacterium]
MASWGRLHTFTLSLALGNNEWLAPFFSLGPYLIVGDGVTVSNSYYRPYDQAGRAIQTAESKEGVKDSPGLVLAASSKS